MMASPHPQKPGDSHQPRFIDEETEIPGIQDTSPSSFASCEQVSQPQAPVRTEASPRRPANSRVTRRTIPLHAAKARVPGMQEESGVFSIGSGAHTWGRSQMEARQAPQRPRTSSENQNAISIKNNVDRRGRAPSGSALTTGTTQDGSGANPPSASHAARPGPPPFRTGSSHISWAMSM
ncbi:hypothetical protein MC885_007766 [Smutsia gigantea]|nr:hypothetical protein MC885_007766 [Smutsia gigantea]